MGNYDYTVQPPNKGHFGNNINSSLLSFVERLSSILGGSNCIRTIGKPIIRNLEKCPLYIERFIIIIVSLSRRVHYRRFDCSSPFLF